MKNDNGVLASILKVRLAHLQSARNPADEAFSMGEHQVCTLIGIVGREALELRGLV